MNLEIFEIIILIVLFVLIVGVLFFLKRFWSKNGRVAESLQSGFDDYGKKLSSEFSQNRKEGSDLASQTRQEIGQTVRSMNDSIMERFSEFSGLQQNQIKILNKSLGKLTDSIAEKLEKTNDKIESRLTSIQKDNNVKLELMRETVDEKLHSSLEKRLGESFNIVSERLERVQHGLGEMQKLATGVGDLKKALTNVRTRGTLGEIQLESILEEILSPAQYDKKVGIKEGSSENVEFAIKLPGNSDNEEPVLLPVDAKFPLDDYTRLIDAYDTGDKKIIAEARKILESKIKAEAKKICSKYIYPPKTSPFAIMYLPTEGLFAEALRIPGLFEQIKRDLNVLIAGPTTVFVIITSYQIGYKTLAIQKRSSEVWKILGAVKTEFGKFGDLLEKTNKKLLTASKSIDDATRKTRTIERKLRSVEELPEKESKKLITIPDFGDEEEE